MRRLLYKICIEIKCKQPQFKIGACCCNLPNGKFHLQVQNNQTKKKKQELNCLGMSPMVKLFSKRQKEMKDIAITNFK